MNVTVDRPEPLGRSYLVDSPGFSAFAVAVAAVTGSSVKRARYCMWLSGPLKPKTDSSRSICLWIRRPASRSNLIVPLLQPLDELRLDLGVVDRRKDLRVDVIVATPVSTFSSLYLLARGHFLDGAVFQASPRTSSGIDQVAADLHGLGSGTESTGRRCPG